MEKSKVVLQNKYQPCSKYECMLKTKFWTGKNGRWLKRAQCQKYLSVLPSFSFFVQDVNNVSFQANLLVQYLPSIVITAVNLIIPQIFSILIRFEDYSPAFEIRLTLLR